jgi:hypothetical protein
MHIARSGIERNGAVWNPPTQLSVEIPEPRIVPPILCERQPVGRIGFPAVRNQRPHPAAQSRESPGAFRRRFFMEFRTFPALPGTRTVRPRVGRGSSRSRKCRWLGQMCHPSTRV